MRKILGMGLLFSAIAWADIVVKADGTVTCTGRCEGTINPNGSITICQGTICITTSGNGPQGKYHL